jgi:hypothetical protein
MIGNRPKLGRICFGMSVVEIVRGMIGNTASGVECTALCG